MARWTKAKETGKNKPSPYKDLWVKQQNSERKPGPPPARSPEITQSRPHGHNKLTGLAAFLRLAVTQPRSQRKGETESETGLKAILNKMQNAHSHRTRQAALRSPGVSGWSRCLYAWNYEIIQTKRTLLSHKCSTLMRVTTCPFRMCPCLIRRPKQSHCNGGSRAASNAVSISAVYALPSTWDTHGWWSNIPPEPTLHVPSCNCPTDQHGIPMVVCTLLAYTVSSVS